MIELYQFPVSHYCEKIRWALDFKGIPYRARNLVPLLHIPVMLKLTRQTQVPAITLGRRAVHGSGRIIDFLEQRYPGKPSLYPQDPAQRQEVTEWQAFCDRDIGPHVRRTAYFHILPDRAYTKALLTEDQGLAGKTFYNLSQLGILAGIRYGMGINPKGYGRSLDKLNAALDRLDQTLADRPYLVGDAFTVADLSAAALLAPLVQPPEMPYPLPPGEPEAFAELRRTLASRPSLQWVQKLYAGHRQGKAGARSRAREDD